MKLLRTTQKAAVMTQVIGLKDSLLNVVFTRQLK